MSLKTNTSELKTTITGAVMSILALIYFGLPYFSEYELWEVNNWYLGVLGIGGIMLILAPDKLIGVAFGWIGRLLNTSDTAKKQD